MYHKQVHISNAGPICCHFGKRIRGIMSDDTRKLSTREMHDICEHGGIKLQTTVPYHPASNGVAERMIGVLTNRRMCYDPQLRPAEIPWQEAFSTAKYVCNRMPTKALDGLTPYEMLYNVKSCQSVAGGGEQRFRGWCLYPPILRLMTTDDS